MAPPGARGLAAGLDELLESLQVALDAAAHEPQGVPGRLDGALRLPLAAVLTAVAVAFAGPALAKDTVKITYIAPLTGGNSANGLGGRNSADLAVKLHNADPKSKYNYELVVLDDECKPEAGVQVATKAAADKSIIAGVTHYCSVAPMSAAAKALAPVLRSRSD